jgi:hypothetical protein
VGWTPCFSDGYEDWLFVRMRMSMHMGKEIAVKVDVEKSTES